MRGNMQRGSAFSTESQIYAFSEVLLALGNHFEHEFFQSWARRILNTPNIGLDDKAQRLIWAKNFTLASGVLADDFTPESDKLGSEHAESE
jgi:hypothetical protein